MMHYEPMQIFEQIIRRLPREINDTYFNKQNNLDKYQILNYSKGEDELDGEESFDESPQPRRLALHKGNASSSKGAIKMGTILETNEEEDNDTFMTLRQSDLSKNKFSAGIFLQNTLNK